MKVGLLIIGNERPSLMQFVLRRLDLALKEWSRNDISFEPTIAFLNRSSGDNNEIMFDILDQSPITIDEIELVEVKLDYNNLIRQGLDKIFKDEAQVDAVVVIEDDVLVCDDFWYWMYGNLDHYKDNENVFCICSDNKDAKNINIGMAQKGIRDIIKSHVMEKAGWGIWRRSWEHINKNWPMHTRFDKGISDLLVNSFKYKLIKPTVPRVTNIGFYNYADTTNEFKDSRELELWYKNEFVRWNSNLFMLEYSHTWNW